MKLQTWKIRFPWNCQVHTNLTLWQVGDAVHRMATTAPLVEGLVKWKRTRRERTANYTYGVMGSSWLILQRCDYFTHLCAMPSPPLSVTTNDIKVSAQIGYYCPSGADDGKMANCTRKLLQLRFTVLLVFKWQIRQVLSAFEASRHIQI